MIVKISGLLRFWRTCDKWFDLTSDVRVAPTTSIDLLLLTTCSRARGWAGSCYPFLTAKERDVETGLDYYGARYANTVQGGFINVDPAKLKLKQLSNPQDLNRYSYVANNPSAFIDPDGREKIRVIVRTFIPEKTVQAPSPGVVSPTLPLPGGRTFAGDGRKVGEPGTYRNTKFCLAHWCLNLKIPSAVLSLSLRSLRLSCLLTQRTLRYAESAEKSLNLDTASAWFKFSTWIIS